MFTEELRREAESLVARYPVGRSALLPLLHLVQAQDGYVSDDGITECADLLGLTKAEVNAVATFYTMYKRAPMGGHLVSVCTNFSCKVRGGQEVYDRLSARLGVGHNATTADGAVTLEHAECLGNCEGAPVVTVDYFNYECMAPQQAEELVDRLIAGEIPPPTRGPIPPGVRDVEYRLAGLGPLDPSTEERASTVDTANQPKPPRPQAGPAPDDEPLHAGFDKEEHPEEHPGEVPDQPAEEAAEGEVAEAGMDPTAVGEESGYSAREFPTERAGGQSAEQYPADDPRGQDQEAPQPAGDRDRSRLLKAGAGDEGIADEPQSDELQAKGDPKQEGEPTADDVPVGWPGERNQEDG